MAHKRAQSQQVLGRRIRFFRLILVVVLVALALRLIDIEGLRSGQYRSAASEELAQPVIVPALRGGIFDRNGQVLALSVPTKTVLADDFQVQHPVSEALALAPMLGVAPTRLAAQLQEHSGYVPLAVNIASAKAGRIAAKHFAGINFIDGSVREVPNANLAAPVIGMVNGTGAGAAGLEYQFNHELAGKAETETLLESPGGVALPGTPVVDHSAARPGKGIELTLDEPLQYETEHSLAAQIVSTNSLSGIAIVMDVRTGDILSMANLVANQHATVGSSATTPVAPTVTIGPSGQVSEAANNLAVSQLYEPGSVFKLVTFSAALQAGIINPNTPFTVPDHETKTGKLTSPAPRRSPPPRSWHSPPTLGPPRSPRAWANPGFSLRFTPLVSGNRAGLASRVSRPACWPPQHSGNRPTTSPCRSVRSTRSMPSRCSTCTTPWQTTVCSFVPGSSKQQSLRAAL